MQAVRKWKTCARIQNQLRALAAGMRGGKKKDFLHRGNYERAARLQPAVLTADEAALFWLLLEKNANLAQ